MVSPAEKKPPTISLCCVNRRAKAVTKILRRQFWPRLNDDKMVRARRRPPIKVIVSAHGTSRAAGILMTWGLSTGSRGGKQTDL